MSIDAPSRASQPTAVAPDPTRSRYPGAPPFSDTELGRRLFYGRAAEAEYVLHSILSTDLFLLYGESGLGKTSLLNAGVLQELREHGFWPVSVRLNDTGKEPVASIRDQIEHAGREDASVDVIMGDDGPDPVALWDVLASLEVWRRNELQHLVVVFDQFEELFTLDWSDDERARFIAEFGEVVRGHRTATAPPGAGLPRPDVRFVIVIREDALGLLEELSADVPQIMRNRFRLGPLDPGQAEAAIREPGRILDERLDSYPSSTPRRRSARSSSSCGRVPSTGGGVSPQVSIRRSCRSCATTSNGPSSGRSRPVGPIRRWSGSTRPTSEAKPGSTAS